MHLFVVAITKKMVRDAGGASIKMQWVFSHL